MVVRKITTTISTCLFLLGIARAQAPESCDCIVDTSGLASYLSTLNLNENQPLIFEVQNASSTFAVLHGYIDGSTPGAVQSFITNYPNVTTLVFMQMPGSDDDEANLQAAQALRNRGYKHYLPAVNAYAQDAFIASGAVDMFVGGLIRAVDVNGEVGVHSWGAGSTQATDYPVGHAYHQPYIDYYIAMGFTQQEAEDFYYFTINAAPASGIHLMTENEINHYLIRSCTYASMPTYSVLQDMGELSCSLDGATSYQWLDCDNGFQTINGANEQNYTPTSNGNYAVLVSENSCSDTSACFSMNNVSILETSRKGLSIFPNPANNQINIPNLEQTTSFQIFQMDGKLISNGSTETGIIDISGVSKGVYWLSFAISQQRHNIQFIKE